MCNTCGCGTPAHRHHNDPAADVHATEPVEARRVAVGEALLAQNDRFAAANRRRFAAARQLVLNLVSGPGAGKTTLLLRTIADLRHRRPIAVVEGDQATDLDGASIRAAGVPAVQINTGSLCHLDAHMVGHAVADLAPPDGACLFIENVGNLVCPAGFDLGEAAKVVLASLPEGDDKPLKYPDMFAAARVCLITKADLAPHVPASLDRLAANARTVNPTLHVFAVSAVTGQGLADWYDWIEATAVAAAGARAALLPEAADA